MLPSLGRQRGGLHAKLGRGRAANTAGRSPLTAGAPAGGAAGTTTGHDEELNGWAQFRGTTEPDAADAAAVPQLPVPTRPARQQAECTS